MSPGKTVKSDPPWDETALRTIAMQVTENLAASRGFLKTLQDDLLVNTKIRVEIQKDLQHLSETVQELNKIVLKGNGQKPLVGQVAVLQSQTRTLEKRLQELKSNAEDLSFELNTVDAKFGETVSNIQLNLAEQSAKFRELLSAEIQLLRASVTERMEAKRDLERESEEKQERTKDRYWSLFVEMVPNILTWLAFLAYATYDYWKNNIPRP